MYYKLNTSYKRSDLKKNFFYNAISSILGIIIPIITTPYIARVLGVSGLGEYSFRYSIAAYFVTVAMLGLNNYGNRTIAAIRDDKSRFEKVYCEIHTMQIFVSLVVFVAYIVYAMFVSNNITTWILCLYVISPVFDLNWYFYGMELFKYTVSRNIIIKLLSTICIFIFVRNGADVWKYCFIVAASFAISNLSLIPFVKKHVHFKFVKFNEFKRHLKPNIVLFIPVIAISVYKLMDKIMLGAITNMENVGYYEAAEKLIQIPNALIVALGTVMLPKMSNLMSNKKNENIIIYLNKATFVSMFIASSMSFGIMAISDELIPLFFGDGYGKCIVLLRFIMPSCIFVAFANIIRTGYLIPKKYDKIYIISVCIGSVVNFIANILLIPYFDSVGASVGTLLAEIVVCLFQYLSVRREIQGRRMITHAIECVIPGIVMFVVVNYYHFNLSNSFLDITLRVMIGIVVYISSWGIMHYLLRYLVPDKCL